MSEYLTVYTCGDDYAYVIRANELRLNQIKIIGGTKIACMVMALQYNRLRRGMRSGIQEVLRRDAIDYGRRFGTLSRPPWGGLFSDFDPIFQQHAVARLQHYSDISHVYAPADRVAR